MFRMKKKIVKNMTTIAYREIFRQCYNIIDRFTRSSHEYCACHFHQGCLREKTLKHCRYIQFQFVRCDCCCVCIFFNTYSLKDLHRIKNNGAGLVTFYISIQNELSIILNIGISEYRQLWKDEKDSYISRRFDLMFPFKVYS